MGLAELPLQPVSDAAAGLVGDDHPLEVLLPAMHSPPRILLATATAAAFLAACAGAPPPSDRVVPRNPATVSDRLQAELRSLGLTVTSGDPGVIAARALNVPADWASCPPAVVGRGGGNHSSSRLVSVRSRHAAIRVVLVPVGDATKVEVVAMFSASYDNPETASSFDRDCRSKGVLEARLLAAAG
ncbi:MAG: hypothetical protein ACJ8H8_19730 [Geminicoccaceae bacterium]